MQLWTGADGDSAFLVIPMVMSREIRAHAFENPRGFRSVRVECTIGELTWRTSLFPRKDGGYFLPVKRDVRRRGGLTIGDGVTVAMDLL